jgi:signal transduction histidine kinase
VNTTATLNALLQKSNRLLEINRELSATLDVDTLLQSIVEAAAELTHSEQASIARYDEENDCLRFIAARWMDPEMMASIRVPLRGSIAGQAFSEQGPVVAHDTQTDSQFFEDVDELLDFTTRSLLAVPMSIRGEVTGVLSAVNKTDGLEFDQEDIYILDTLASQAAIALHNAQLLRASEEALRALTELDEMKSNFVAITSHELRIPLGLILGHASYLKEISEGDTNKQVNVIERAALRLKDIVEDLSRVEAMQSGQSSLRSSALDLRALVEMQVEAHRLPAAERGIRLQAHLPNSALEMRGEADKLETVIEHLLENAIAFTDKDGLVEVRLEDQGDWVVLRVSDTGIGIPEEDLERIFERFYQVESHMTRRHGGLGLGLAVSKILVEMHGGRIEVQSVVGAGSQFSVWLPRQQPAAG